MVNLVKDYGSNEHPSKFYKVRLPYLVEVEVTAEQLIAAKGGAIAAADFYDVIGVPPGTVVLGAWLKKGSAFEGTSTDINLQFGTAATADLFVATLPLDDAAVGAWGTGGDAPAAGAYGFLYTAQTPFRVTVSAMTGTWTGGSIRAQVLALDLRDKGDDATIAQLGS